jgi:outer membrane protein assembly factor BamB
MMSLPLPRPSVSASIGPDPTASAPPAPSASAEPPRCVEDAWPELGHDGRRTSASLGCLTLPIQVRWKATATPPVSARPASYEHAIVAGGAIFVAALAGKSSMVHRLGLDGAHTWVFDTRNDLHFAYWLTAAHGVVMMNDDGTFLLDPDTGKIKYNRGLDCWGQSVADGERFFWVNAWHIHGPPLFMGGFTAEGMPLWKQNKLEGVEPHDMMDDLGAVSTDGSLVVQSANYKFSPISGLFAFHPATGARRWAQAVLPLGGVSLGGGRVHGLERVKGVRQLKARSQESGEEIWSTPLKGALSAAPALGGNLVLVDTEKDGLHAFDAATGQLVWKTEPRGKQIAQVGNETTVAIALGNGLVVWTIKGEIVLLSLQTGEIQTVLPLGKHAHSPVIASGTLLVTVDGEIVAVGP